MVKKRKELMQELNALLGTKFNWSRINLLDLKRLVESVKNRDFEDSIGGECYGQ